jgi:16S rRNA (cytidine1402-2'-O)-methyltransferase
LALFIIATPIGNLGDMTYRAVATLNEVDLVLAEDTRVSKVLLNHYNITKPMISYHDFNKERVTPQIIGRLKNGEKIALISDAGTPGLADPAYNLVRDAIKENIPVHPLPGASALLAGLVCSGLPTDRFVFEYFLPVKSGRRIRLIESFKSEPRTIIFYETPHKIIKLLNELNSIIPDASIAIGRELTKMHEEFLRGTPSAILKHFEKRTPKGEFVVVINTRIQQSIQSEETDDETD